MMYGNGLKAVLGLALVAALVAGCAGVAPGVAPGVAQGPSDEEQIRALIGKFVQAGNKGEIEAVMSCFAENFMTDSGDDKASIRDQLEGAGGVEFSAENLKITIAKDGKTAEVDAVEIDNTPYIAGLTKRDGKWLITSGRE